MKNPTKHLCMSLYGMLSMMLVVNNLSADEQQTEDARGSAVLIGASYVQSWNISKIGNLKVLNAGVDGQESHELLLRFQSDVVDHDPQMVIIWGYINDIHRNPADRIKETKTRARDSFIEMIRQAREAGIEPVVATEVTLRPVSGWVSTATDWIGRLLGKESYKDFVNYNVRELNDWLRNYAREQDIPLLDFEVQLSGPDGRRLPEYAKSDGSHLTPVAYERLEAYTQKKLP